MPSRESSTDPIEVALGELNEATTAGVFCKTHVDPRSLTNVPVRRMAGRSARAVYGLLGVAAMLALVAGVWTALFRSELARLRSDAMVATADDSDVDSSLPPVRPFVLGLKGPAETSTAVDSLTADLDGDGRSDLRDYAQYQLAYAGPSR